MMGICKGLKLRFWSVNDAEQVSSLGLLSQVKVLNQVGPTLTLGQGLGVPRPMLTWHP